MARDIRISISYTFLCLYISDVLLILKGFEKKKNDWRGGTIYDPENDKTYDARIKRLDDGNLQLKGCVGPFCQTQVWPEYEGE